MKQLRFTSLVQAAGRPHPATLWTTDPNKDPEFKSAIAENRVVTIHTTNVGAKKDKAHIGFAKGPSATYLIFPKPLPMEAGHPIIGLKFDLLEEPEINDPIKIKPAKRKPKTATVRTAKEEKVAEEKIIRLPKGEKPKKVKPPTFLVTVRSTATITRELKVQAATATAALAQAEASASKSRMPKPDWQHEALEARKLP